MHKRDTPGLLVALAGLVIFIVSAGADSFHLGKSPGFGRLNSLGVLVGVLAIIAGALLMPGFREKLSTRKAAVLLLASGAVLLLTALFADPLGVGIFPQFGIMQIIGVLLGAGAMIYGGRQLRRKNPPEPVNSDTQS
jgi:peptidoglycan/LPS O-acetylase OafA/YrhL